VTRFAFYCRVRRLTAHWSGPSLVLNSLIATSPKAGVLRQPGKPIRVGSTYVEIRHMQATLFFVHVLDPEAARFCTLQRAPQHDLGFKTHARRPNLWSVQLGSCSPCTSQGFQVTVFTPDLLDISLHVVVFTQKWNMRVGRKRLCLKRASRWCVNTPSLIFCVRPSKALLVRAIDSPTFPHLACCLFSPLMILD
jgi:hypothetical protein